MRNIPNTSGPVSNSETSWEDGSVSVPLEGKLFYKNLKNKANAVPIIRIFKHYGVNVDENRKTTTCPFQSHKGGRERTPSFNYYPETNTYYCFGCHKGSTCCDFVSSIDKITTTDAAYKILETFASDNDCIILQTKDNFVEQFQISLDFSNAVREFRTSHFDDKSFKFIERVCKVYDDMNSKHELDNIALRFLVDQLKIQINDYL